MASLDALATAGGPVAQDVASAESDKEAAATAARRVPVTRAVILLTACVCTASFLAGYNTGVISGVLVLIEEDPDFYYDNPLIEGLIASASVMGSFCGILLSGTPLGRRRPLMAAALIGVTAASFMLWSPSVWILVGGRFAAGFGSGLAGVQVPLYLAECAPAARRGYVVSANYFMIVIGVLTSYVVNFIVVMLSSDNWRVMLGIIIAPASLMFLALLTVPESPRWLVSKHRIAEATAVLRRLRATDNVSAELRGIVNSLFTTSLPGVEPAALVLDGPESAAGALNDGAGDTDDDDDDDGKAGSDSRAPLLGSKTAASAAAVAMHPDVVATKSGPSLRMLFSRPDARKALLLCAGLEFLQSFSGIQAVTFYTPVILRQSGVAFLFVDLGLSEAASVILMTMLIYSCKIPFLYLGMANVDRIGRRNMLLITLPIMALSLAGVAISFALPADTDAGAILAIIATTTFGCSYTPGLGSVLSVIESEIYASDIRSTGLVVTGLIGSVLNMLIVQFYPKMSDELGDMIVFSIFAGVSALGCVYVFFLVPETKQETLEVAYRKVIRK